MTVFIVLGFRSYSELGNLTQGKDQLTHLILASSSYSPSYSLATVRRRRWILVVRPPGQRRFHESSAIHGTFACLLRLEFAKHAFNLERPRRQCASRSTGRVLEVNARASGGNLVRDSAFRRNGPRQRGTPNLADCEAHSSPASLACEKYHKFNLPAFFPVIRFPRTT